MVGSQVGIPGTGVSRGGSYASQILGGELSANPSYAEMDIVPIYWTEEARKDLLLQGMRNPTYIVSGHQKSTRTLPPDAILLASSSIAILTNLSVSDVSVLVYGVLLSGISKSSL